MTLSSSEITNRTLDTAVASMSRCRVLLFAINILCAMCFIIIYIERYSIDEWIAKNHLSYIVVAQTLTNDCGLDVEIGDYLDKPEELAQIFLDHAVPLCPHKKKTTEKPSKDLTEAQESISDKSSIDPKILQQDVDANTINQDRNYSCKQCSVNTSILRTGSRVLRTVHMIQNEMNSIRLPRDQTLPFGLDIPQNEFAPVASVLITVMYSWLFFSFRHLRNAVSSLRHAVHDNTDSASESGKLLSSMLGVYFMFSTTGRGIVSWAVFGLYYLAPITVAFVLLNEIASVRSHASSMVSSLAVASIPRFMVLIATQIILLVIAYHIHKEDSNINSEVQLLNEKSNG